MECSCEACLTQRRIHSDYKKLKHHLKLKYKHTKIRHHILKEDSTVQLQSLHQFKEVHMKFKYDYILIFKFLDAKI